MVYRNDSPGAVYAMEEGRTGNYGYDCYEDEPEACPACGSVFVDFYYKNSDGECVGCSECLYRSNTPY